MSWTYFIWIVAIALVPLVLNVFIRFIWAPIKVHGSQTLALKPPSQPVDVSKLSPEMREFIRSITDRLREVGFENLGLFGHTGAVPGVKSAEAILVNRSTQDIAVVIVTQSGSTRGLVYAIRTDFSDGSRISTGVNPGIGIWPQNPTDFAQGFPFVEDPMQLYEAHHCLLDRHGLKVRPRRPAPTLNQAADYQKWDWDRNLCWPLKLRYYWIDEPAQLCRMTWKGAFLMTWRLVTPIKQWRISIRDRRARKIWASLPIGPVRTFAMESSVSPSTAMRSVEYDEAQSPIPELPAMLSYEAHLAEGEVRTEFTANRATVRAGSAPPLRVLGRQRWRLASLLFFGACSGLLLYNWWTLRSMVRSLPRVFPPGFAPKLSPVVWVWVGFFLLDVLRIVNALRFARGTTVVMGSPSGLRFTNAPAGAADGAFARSRVESLTIVPRLLGFRKKGFSLTLALHGTTGRVVLFNGNERESVVEARDALAQAMGIEVPAETEVVVEATA